MPSVKLRRITWCAVLVFEALVTACTTPVQDSTGTTFHSPSAETAVSSHDLAQDEAAGGHTLRKHVGRSDAELRERLEKEPNIAAASTYTDRVTAEKAIGLALEQNRAKVQRWLARSGGHPNQVLDYSTDGDHPVGRTLRRGQESSQPCSHALVVLRWSGDDHYYVLTSYPECR